MYLFEIKTSGCQLLSGPEKKNLDLYIIPRKSLIDTLEILAKIPHKIQNNIPENPSPWKHLGSPICNDSAFLD